MPQKQRSIERVPAALPLSDTTFFCLLILQPPQYRFSLLLSKRAQSLESARAAEAPLPRQAQQMAEQTTAELPLPQHKQVGCAGKSFPCFPPCHSLPCYPQLLCQHFLGHAFFFPGRCNLLSQCHSTLSFLLRQHSIVSPPFSSNFVSLFCHFSAISSFIPRKAA